MDHTRLRPMERCILRLSNDGVDHSEIGRRFRRSPEFIERVLGFTKLPGRAAIRDPRRLRPLERRVLRWLEEGVSHVDIAPRFHRSPDFVERVEVLALYKLSVH